MGAIGHVMCIDWRTKNFAWFITACCLRLGAEKLTEMGVFPPGGKFEGNRGVLGAIGGDGALLWATGKAVP